MKSPTPLRAPFPYFGGKRDIAALVWSRLGNVDNYLVPFAGSIPDILLRPHEPKKETINDLDPMVSNFWRAIQANPALVAKHADWPVIETDMHARHKYLVLSKDAEKFRRKMKTDPTYFDARIAGWWAWGLCCWIGGGWCTPHGQTKAGGRKETRVNCKGRGLTRGQHQRPGDARGAASIRKPRVKLAGNGIGVGVNRKALSQAMPTAEQCDSQGKGINGVGPKGARRGSTAPATWDSRPLLDDFNNQNRLNPPKGERPELWNTVPTLDRNRGVNSGGGRPQLADAFDIGRGVNANGQASTCADRRAWLVGWFQAIADRIRLTRVCCGDWKRICSSRSVTTRLGLTGINFDPPYAHSIDRMHAWVLHMTGKGPKPKIRGKASNRDASLYATDRDDVDRLVAEVNVYCQEWGQKKGIRIALCGYEGEHNNLELLGWIKDEWESHGGYGNRSAKGQANKKRERVWFSPNCLTPTLGGIFTGVEESFA